MPSALKLNLNIYSVFSTSLMTSSVVLVSWGVLCGLMGNSYFIEWELGVFSGVSIVMSLIVDWMSLVFLSVVSLISGSIMKYSFYYMKGDMNYLRFVFILASFVGSMWFLILSPNLISLLLGWDGLGLTSYALVIYYQSESSCAAGMLTVLSNRVGDVAILMSVGLLCPLGSWSFIFYDHSGGFLIMSLIMLAGMTKSAQMPFSAWLPAAMAAPTPVSALVHSSTLVTAGVYLLIRFSKILLDSGIGWYLLVISTMTMFMAGLGANFETDLKKVVALSTLSQLGLMLMVLSIGLPELAFFHLVTHALFKSTLFMCVGYMIHSSNGGQDGRMISGFSVSSPVLGLVFSCVNLALGGFPFLAGFYSKDVILELLFAGSLNMWLVLLVVVATGLTISYSVRLVFLGVNHISVMPVASSNEDLSLLVIKSVSGLFILSLTGGFLFFYLVNPISEGALLSGVSKYFVLGVSVGFGLISFFKVNSMESKNFKKVLNSIFFSGSSRMWFSSFLSTKQVSGGPIFEGSVSNKLLDGGWSEYYGGQGGKHYFMGLSSTLQSSQVTIGVSGYFLSVALGLSFLFSVV